VQPQAEQPVADGWFILSLPLQGIEAAHATAANNTVGATAAPAPMAEDLIQQQRDQRVDQADLPQAPAPANSLDSHQQRALSGAADSQQVAAPPASKPT
jgi:hypothetical protein